MSNSNRFEAKTTGGVLALILTSRADTNLADSVAAQIAELAAGVDRYYASSTGTGIVTFTDEGASANFSDQPWYDDLTRRINFLNSHVPTDPDTLEEELRAVEAGEQSTPLPHFFVECTFVDHIPVSFTDEVVMSGGRVQWHMPVERI